MASRIGHGEISELVAKSQRASPVLATALHLSASRPVRSGCGTLPDPRHTTSLTQTAPDEESEAEQEPSPGEKPQVRAVTRCAPGGVRLITQVLGLLLLRHLRNQNQVGDELPGSPDDRSLSSALRTATRTCCASCGTRSASSSPRAPRTTTRWTQCSPPSPRHGRQDGPRKRPAPCRPRPGPLPGGGGPAGHLKPRRRGGAEVPTGAWCMTGARNPTRRDGARRRSTGVGRGSIVRSAVRLMSSGRRLSSV